MARAIQVTLTQALEHSIQLDRMKIAIQDEFVAVTTTNFRLAITSGL
jgi:hypothetical protein